MILIRRIIKAILVFITSLCRDPIAMKEKISSALGIRG